MQWQNNGFAESCTDLGAPQAETGNHRPAQAKRAMEENMPQGQVDDQGDDEVHAMEDRDE